MIRIRPYQKPDYSTVYKILRESEMGTDKTWDSESNYSSMIEDDKKRIIVAVDGDKVIGVIIITYFGAEVSWFFRLVVKKGYREHGVGSKLLKKAEKIAKRKGAKEVGFYVNTSKKELYEYYSKRGYKTSGRKYSYMWKPI